MFEVKLIPDSDIYYIENALFKNCNIGAKQFINVFS